MILPLYGVKMACACICVAHSDFVLKTFNCQKQKKREEKMLANLWKLCLQSESQSCAFSGFCLISHEDFAARAVYANAGKPKLKPARFSRTPLALQCEQDLK